MLRDTSCGSGEPRRLILALLLAAAVCAQAAVLPDAAAQEVTPGRCAWVAAGGTRTAGAWEQVAAIGQPASAVAFHDPAGKSLSAGILAGLVEPFVIRERPAESTWIEAGDTLSVEAEIVSPTPADSVLLYYRLAGQREFTCLPMLAQSDGDWAAVIPEEAIGLRGVEYYIEAHEPGRVTRSPVRDYDGAPLQQGVQVVEDHGEGALAVAAGACRMISVPAVLADGSVEAVLGDDLGEPSEAWRCGRWDPESRTYAEAGTEAAQSFAPGKAFWLFTRAARTVDFTGGTVFAAAEEGIAIPLSPGWNQIGNPFAYDVALGDVLIDDGTQKLTLAQAVAAELLEAWPLHAYDGQHHLAETEVLAPWTGYFIANLGETAIDLVLPANEAYLWSTPQSPVPAPAPDWSLQLTARLGDGAPVTLGMGSADEAAPGWDTRDQLMPPAAFEQAMLARVVNTDMSAGLQAMRCDVRPVTDPGDTWAVELVTGKTGPVRLTWELPEELPDGYGVRLIDLESEIWIDCAPGGAYETEITEPGVAQLRIVVGTPECLEQEAEIAAPAGDHFAYSLIGGNPHTGCTQLRLVLQRPERVSLRAFDVNGRLIRTLQEGDLAAGVYQLAWDGRTQRGERVGAGVYFMRLIGAGREVVLRSVVIR